MRFTQSVQLDNVEFPDVDSMVDYFTNAVVRAAAMNIPQSSIKPRRVPVPWWTDECRDTIRALKHALKQFQIHPIQKISFLLIASALPLAVPSGVRKDVLWRLTSLLCPAQHPRTSSGKSYAVCQENVKVLYFLVSLLTVSQ
jgi:hypothetical protein